MIEVPLPDGPASPLLRSLAACLSSVTEVPLHQLPDLGDAPVTHALGTYKGWLAGRGFGLVPIHEPRSFQWAGWWIAVLDGSDSPLADGPRRQVAVLAFGTPPGVVLSPQHPALLGRATADLDISSAYAVASLDPVLAPGPPDRACRAPWSCSPSHCRPKHPCGSSGRPAHSPAAACRATVTPTAPARPALAARTILGTSSPSSPPRSSRTSPRAMPRSTSPAPGAVLTRGIDVNALVGRDFTIGDVRCRGLRLAEPCAHLKRLHGPGLLRPLIHRGGLRADILSDGDIGEGSPIRT